MRCPGCRRTVAESDIALGIVRTGRVWADFRICKDCASEALAAQARMRAYIAAATLPEAD